jgi:hypothetical protein
MLRRWCSFGIGWSPCWESSEPRTAGRQRWLKWVVSYSVRAYHLHPGVVSCHKAQWCRPCITRPSGARPVLCSAHPHISYGESGLCARNGYLAVRSAALATSMCWLTRWGLKIFPPLNSQVAVQGRGRWPHTPAPHCRGGWCCRKHHHQLPCDHLHQRHEGRWHRRWCLDRADWSNPWRGRAAGGRGGAQGRSCCPSKQRLESVLERASFHLTHGL